ncbi:UbiX family flavin prenyltransferase [Streptomyces sp. BE308]|uniref:UbiX family flavin prenyltransferase n=1 Tax=unclassified Streptomyces TaxID=2593676 RepID=UPI002DDB6861|nr:MULTISPECIES: UbiX family flavin prenyltransferase [unclassified Streptomyces]MEE1790346.1 UbiX family flavin prenyltransferase [Streptomyces sp. BE308]WRZ78714.1 UbiX family flavin prenyltransferase [Streptomyces sp. NBC_01237]
MRIVVGVTGATGAPIALRLLEVLREVPEVETHLVLSTWARSTIEVETSRTSRQFAELADVSHKFGEQGATISSGSYPVAGMVIVPCSMKTLAAVRHGFADNLIARAADVTLKERRPLVLVPRETPLNEIHLENMLALSRMGARIVPPMPAFYDIPRGIGDIVDHIVMRILDQFQLPAPTADIAERWQGLGDARSGR